MYSVPVPTFASRCLSSCATNSRPLSERMFSGILRNSITSARASITSYLPSLLATRMTDSPSFIHRSASASAAFFRHASSRSQSRSSKRDSHAPAAAELMTHHSATTACGAGVSAAPSAPRDARCAVPDLCQPTITLQKRRNSPVSAATVFTGQCSDRFGQRPFVNPLDRGIALCSSPLPQQLASMALAHFILFARMLHRTTPPLRAQKFPRPRPLGSASQEFGGLKLDQAKRLKEQLEGAPA
jgi:hypothetical protein